jgi:hypothetical protein
VLVNKPCDFVSEFLFGFLRVCARGGDAANRAAAHIMTGDYGMVDFLPPSSHLATQPFPMTHILKIVELRLNNILVRNIYQSLTFLYYSKKGTMLQSVITPHPICCPPPSPLLNFCSISLPHPNPCFTSPSPLSTFTSPRSQLCSCRMPCHPKPQSHNCSP